MGFKVSKELNVENILKQISEYDIFKAYCIPFTEVGKMFLSELREDHNPTCKISVNIATGDLMYGDFNGGRYNCFKYVQVKYSVDFNTTLNIINRDFKLGLFPSWSSEKAKTIDTLTETKITNKVFKTKHTILKKRKREWDIRDTNYWYTKYSITKETLNYFKVEPIDYYWVNNNRFKCNTITYSYEFTNGARDIYAPLASSYKWAASTTKAHHVYGYSQLPVVGNVLFIVSSLKEVMLLHEMGVTAVASQSESTFIPLSILIDLQNRFVQIIILYDFDHAGIKYAKQFGEQFKLDYMKFNEDMIVEYGGKDLSDAFEVDRNKIENLIINYEKYI